MALCQTGKKVITENLSFAVRTIVNRLLSDWVSFQIAIEQGMGGEDRRLKEEWMTQVVSDYLIKHDDLDDADVEKYIEEILFQEFDTVIDDGTVRLVAALMLQLRDICRRRGLQEALEQLPSQKPAMPHVRAEPERPQLLADEDDFVKDEEMRSIVQQVENCLGGVKTSRRRTNDPDSDGWITVGKTNTKI